MAAGISDKQEAIVGQRHSNWLFKAREVLSSIAGMLRTLRDGCDISGRSDFANRVVGRVGDKDIALLIYGDSAWSVEHGRRGVSILQSGRARARDCCDLSIRRDFADAVVVGIGDIDVARLIYSDADWPVKLRFIGGTIFESLNAAARY